MSNATLNQMIETARSTFAGATAATLAEYAQITMARLEPDATFNNWEYGYVRQTDGAYHINTYQPSGFAFRLAFTFTATGMQVKYDISHQNRLTGELSLSYDVTPSGIALALTDALEIHLTGRVDYGRFN